jgi:hypothetical protein
MLRLDNFFFTPPMTAGILRELRTEGTLTVQVTEDFSHADYFWRELHRVNSESFVRRYSVPLPSDIVWWDEGWHRMAVGLLLEELA